MPSQNAYHRTVETENQIALEGRAMNYNDLMNKNIKPNLTFFDSKIIVITKNFNFLNMQSFKHFTIKKLC